MVDGEDGGEKIDSLMVARTKASKDWGEATLNTSALISWRIVGNFQGEYGADLFSFTALVSGEKSNFQYIIRLLNTNVDGKQKIMYALTKIKGVGRRYSNLVCKKADVDLSKRYVFLSLQLHNFKTVERDFCWWVFDK